MSDYRAECKFCGDLYYGYHKCEGLLKWEQQQKLANGIAQKELDKEYEEFVERACQYEFYNREILEQWVRSMSGKFLATRREALNAELERLEHIEDMHMKVEAAYQMGFEDGIQSAFPLAEKYARLDNDLKK